MNKISVRSFRTWHCTIYTGWMDGRNQANNMENESAGPLSPTSASLPLVVPLIFSFLLRFPFLSAHFQFFLVLVKQLGNVKFKAVIEIEVLSSVAIGSKQATHSVKIKHFNTNAICTTLFEAFHMNHSRIIGIIILCVCGPMKKVRTAQNIHYSIFKYK